ncbi:MAG: hypothetical protein QM594_11355 [Niabella sp.]
MSSSKRIIIGLPTTFDFYKIIAKHLREKGFEVIDISYQAHDFKYKNFSQKAYNFFRKTFLRDRHYKNKLRFRFFENEATARLMRIEGKADYALFIRADAYPRSVIQLAKSKSKKLIGYQWDGLNRFKAINDYIPLFDRFFVFTTADLCTKGVLPVTNFYFKKALKEKKAEKEAKTAFFVGSYEKSRMGIINSFSKKIAALDYTPRFHIFLPAGRRVLQSDYEYITFFSERISYEQYLEATGEATVLIDFLNQKHTGLSFRVFEALGYDKKLITDNETITKYDFYHPDNIFVLSENNWEKLESFLRKPYYPISRYIKEKYSFDNWINYVLDEPPYQEIVLPE